MLWGKRSIEILSSERIRSLEEKYKEKFGVWFPAFNYEHYKGTEERDAAEVYGDAIEEALKGDKPVPVRFTKEEQYWIDFLENEGDED